MSNDPILRVQDVSHAFGGVRAVDDCSLQITAGIITAIIGPNGAGKSTLIEVITSGLRLQTGSVHYRGSNISRTPPHLLAGLGLYRTYQLSREFAALTVLENLLVVAPEADESLLGAVLLRGRMKRRRDAATERALDVLERFGLLAMRNEPASTLSGGQKRLLELARAVMCRPRLLFLDEPAAGINPALITLIEGHLRRMLAEDGTTLVIVEHNLSLVERLCDHVIVLAEGRVLAEGSMAEHRDNDAVVSAYLGSAA